MTRQFITFTIGAEEYGIDIMAIREIKGWITPTEIPDTPIYMRGVIDLRGTIVPILDLRTRFSGQKTLTTPRHVTMVVTLAGKVVGLLVDAVADILSVEESDIQTVPEMNSTHSEKFLSGLVTIDGRMVALLDLARVFDRDVIDSFAA